MLQLVGQLVLLIALAGAGTWGGLWLARRGGWGIMAGFVLPMILLAGVIAGRRSVWLSFIEPIRTLNRPDVTFAVMALAIAMIFATLTPRLVLRRQRIAVWGFAVFVLIYFSVLPVVLPVVVRPSLLATPTKWDARGVCRQSHEYTCGPAAAVSALLQLGVAADDALEGPIAVAAGSAPAEGTDADVLAATLSKMFGPEYHVHAEYRWLGTLPELEQALAARGPGRTVAIVSVCLGLLVHHYVTVLELTPDDVVVADPALGLMCRSRAEFEDAWGGAAVIMWRQ